ERDLLGVAEVRVGLVLDAVGGALPDDGFCGFVADGDGGLDVLLQFGGEAEAALLRDAGEGVVEGVVVVEGDGPLGVSTFGRSGRYEIDPYRGMLGRRCEFVGSGLDGAADVGGQGVPGRRRTSVIANIASRWVLRFAQNDGTLIGGGFGALEGCRNLDAEAEGAVDGDLAVAEG